MISPPHNHDVLKNKKASKRVSYYTKWHNQSAASSQVLNSILLAHLRRRLIGEVIGYSWSGVHPSVVRRRPQCSKIFSETALPIKAKFYVEPPWVTVGKHTPCKLSFVYTSYIRYGVRAAPKFGKHALPFSYHNK